jgi:hypothetical protein
MIDPNNCPKETTEFGVKPSQIGSTILETCGDTRDETCTFQEIATLQDAITICHFHSDICFAFSFAPATLPEADGTFSGTMSIIDTEGGHINSSIYDTYVQQISVITS